MGANFQHTRVGDPFGKNAPSGWRWRHHNLDTGQCHPHGSIAHRHVLGQNRDCATTATTGTPHFVLAAEHGLGLSSHERTNETMLTFFPGTSRTFASTAAVMVQQLPCLLTAIVIGGTSYVIGGGRTRLQVKVQPLGFLAARIVTLSSQDAILSKKMKEINCQSE